MTVPSKHLRAVPIPAQQQLRQHAPKHADALQPLTGLRACANIGIMILHILWLRTHLPGGPGNVPTTLKLRLMAALFVLQTSMDVLFLLCGFHTALTLLPALSKAGGQSPLKVVLQYWWRRAVRIVPAYYVALAASWFLMMHPAVRRDPEPVPEAASALDPFDPAACPSGLWLAAAFVNNWGPIPGCGSHFWSQAVMAQFWAVAPLVLAALRPRQPGFRSRVAFGAGVVIALSTAYRVATILRHDLRMPLPAFSDSNPLQGSSFAAYTRSLHMSLAARLGSIAVGVLLALPFTGQQDDASSRASASAGEQLPRNWGRWPRIAAAATACAAAAAAWSRLPRFDPAVYAEETPWPFRVSLPFMALMLQGGMGISSVLALLTYAGMTKIGMLGRVLHWLLSARLWQPLADLSYSAYLYHIQVRVWVWRNGLLPSGLAKSAEDMRGLAFETAAVMAATYACAWLSLQLVERPASRMLRGVWS